MGKPNNLEEVTEEEFIAHKMQLLSYAEESVKRLNEQLDELYLMRSLPEMQITYYRDGCQYIMQVEVKEGMEPRHNTPLQDYINKITGVKE